MSTLGFSSERLVHYVKRSALRSSKDQTPLDAQVYKIVLEYILEILALDASPFSSSPFIPSSSSFSQQQQHHNSIIVEYSSGIGTNGKIESERYTSAQELISRKISMCVFLQEYSFVLFRNNIPK